MLTDRLKTVKGLGKEPAILVVGDLMLDHYISGCATRLSPEAPVPVVNVGNENLLLGGAGNVAGNLVTLGARVLVAGVVGKDLYGEQLNHILNKADVDTHGVIADPNRSTTVKTRVLVGSHQMIRIDREVTDELCVEAEQELLQWVEHYMDEADVVILSDYNKGLFSHHFTQQVIRLACLKEKKVAVDPKGLSYEKYSGAYIIKPNRKELAEAANVEHIKTEAELLTAARMVLQQTNAIYLIVTLSEDGMAIISRDDHRMMPVKASAVFDVTGAGDTVMAAMCYALALGFDIDDACTIANHAAAIVIQQVGSATTTVSEIIEYMQNNEYNDQYRNQHGVVRAY